MFKLFEKPVSSLRDVVSTQFLHRLHIARVLVAQDEAHRSGNTTVPQDIFLLDEVSCGLDVKESKDLIQMILERLPQSSTVLCISHQECLRDLFDREIVLKKSMM